MTSGSKAFFRRKLAFLWKKGLMTRPTWSTKWRVISTKVWNVREGKVSKEADDNLHLYERARDSCAAAVGGAWEHEVRNAPDVTF